MASSYPGGWIYAVKRNDVDPAGPAKPAYYRFDTRAEAQQWWLGALEMAKANLPDDEDRWPELVCSPLTWVRCN